METILEMILETIGTALFTFPGAFIRWCFTGFRKSYKEVLFDDSEFNAPVGFLATFITVLGIVLLTACNNVQDHNPGNDTVKVERKDH